MVADLGLGPELASRGVLWPARLCRTCKTLKADSILHKNCRQASLPCRPGVSGHSRANSITAPPPKQYLQHLLHFSLLCLIAVQEPHNNHKSCSVVLTHDMRSQARPNTEGRVSHPRAAILSGCTCGSLRTCIISCQAQQHKLLVAPSPCMLAHVLQAKRVIKAKTQLCTREAVGQPFTNQHLHISTMRCV